MNNSGGDFMESLRNIYQANNPMAHQPIHKPMYDNGFSNSNYGQGFQEPGFSLSNGMLSNQGRPVQLSSSIVG